MKTIEELTLRYLDDELSDDELARLDELVDTDPEARDAFVALVEQEGLLRGLSGGQVSVDVSEATVRRIREKLSARVEEGVMKTIRESQRPAEDSGPETQPSAEQQTTDEPAEPVAQVEPLSRWIGRRAVYLALAAAVLIVAATSIEPIQATLEPVPEQELHVYGQDKVTPGMPAAYRAYVQNGRTGQALAGVATRCRLVDDQGQAVWEEEARTDNDGMVLIEPTIAESAEEGSYRLEVRVDHDSGPLEVTRDVQVRRSFRLFLSTDKPRYQPGQLIHIRALALFAMDRHPVSDREVTISVRDGRGNKVFNKRLTTSDFGLTSADFQLADQVNMGEFQIEATIGDTTSQRSVTVERYRLPRFRIDLSTTKSYYAPGDTVTGELTARYTYGEPVAGAKVSLVASEFIETFRPFKTVEGTTDDQGRFHFELPLKEHFVGQPLKQGDGLVSFEATVTDRAQHSQDRTLERTVTTTPIRVDVVPESGELVPGVDNTLYVVTSTPDGQPVAATVTVAETGDVVRTDEAGFGELRWRADGPSELHLTVADAGGRETQLTQSLRVDAHGQEALLLRTDRATYRSGDSARLTVLTAASTRRVFIDVVKERQTVLTTAIDVADGHGELTLDLPPELSGTLAITCYRVVSGGEIVSDTKLIQVAEAQDLRVVATLDHDTYHPADTATLSLQVLRGGDPAAAALSLWGVDEAVFALEEARPGLERVYFALQEELLEPRYEIHGHLSPSALAASPDEAASGANAEVVLAAARGIDGPGEASAGSYGERLQEKIRRVESATRSLWALVALSPSILFGYLLLLLLAFGAVRLFKRRVVACDDELEVAAMRRRFRGLVVLWVFAFWVPLLGAAAAAALAGYRYKEEAAIVAGIVLALGSIVGLFLSSRSIRRASLSREFPVLRRLVALLPWAYICWLVAMIALFAASEGVRILSYDTPILVMIAMYLGVALAAGVLSFSGASVLSAMSTLRALWIVASRATAAAAPTLFFASLMFLTSGSALEADMAAPVALAPPQMEAAGAEEIERLVRTRSLDSGGEPLKAPSRIRRHFPETLLWRPEVITDAQGRATVEVPLADSITTWRVGVGAVSADGLLGSTELGIRVFQPFFVDVDLPLALTQNDEVQLNVGVYSYLATEQTVRIELDATDWLEVRGGRSTTVHLGPREITQVAFTVVARRPGEHPVTIRAFGSEMADAVERRVRVAPDGRAVVDTRNGQLEQGATEDLTIPTNAIAGANDLVLKIYPGAFSQVVEGLDGILRMPSGCFEQTSSATYPNVLVLDYLRRTHQANAELEMRAQEYINTGYQRLLSYEVDGGGFEWFGHSPAHTVLTAYGLMEFSDMAEVFEVDHDVIDRTRRWLLDQQSSDGSFRPTEGGIAEGAINAYQGQVLRTTAYVTWALAESGEREPRLDAALRYIETNIGTEDDPYTLAVAANALIAGGRDVDALLRRLDGMKTRDGSLVHWSSESEGATYSRGESLDMETTAIAAYAYLRARYATDTAHAALAWLVANKDSFGTWQSTQATVHAMRALLLGASRTGNVDDEIVISVVVNDEAEERLTVTEETADVVHTVSLGEHVRTGQNRVRLEVTGQGDLAYQLVATHYVPRGEGEGEAVEPLSIEVSYDTTSLAAGDTLTARASITYNREGAAQMTLVDLGIPPGFELQTDAFDELQRAGRIERYTTTGRQVVLYFRELRSGEPVTFEYQMRAQYPLRVQTPRSTAYQYYEPEVRDETEPVELTVR